MAPLTVRGVPLYVEREGSGSPLVLIHGQGDDSGLWAPVTAAFSRAFCVYRYDLRGHGRSGGAPPPARSLDEHVADLLALLDALDIDAAHLAGHDLGGQIAQRLAHTAPDRVRTLTVEGTLPALLGEPALLLQTTDLQPESEPGRITGARLSRERASALLASHERFRLLGEIATPTLVIIGALDELAYQQGAELLHGWIPASRLVRVEDAGHTPHIEQPERFTAHLRAFLIEFNAGQYHSPPQHQG